MAFIDGHHRFEQVLRDFMYLEAYCGPRSVLLLHDTLPLNEATQSRHQETRFWTGDVWRAVLCLKAYRADLHIQTVATAPSGLTIITGLDPQSTVLATRFREACERFVAVPYRDLVGRAPELLNIVPNHWESVAAKLAALREQRRSSTIRQIGVKR